LTSAPNFSASSFRWGPATSSRTWTTCSPSRGNSRHPLEHRGQSRPRRCTWPPGRTGRHDAACPGSAWPGCGPRGPDRLTQSDAGPVEIGPIEAPGVTPHSRVQARTCAANASLSSRRSLSINPSSAPPGPARPPVPIRCPSSAEPRRRLPMRRRARGRSPSPAGRWPMVPTQIAARSFWPEALPAVTVGSGSSRVRTGRVERGPRQTNRAGRARRCRPGRPLYGP
jgi:hypothetical protein